MNSAKNVALLGLSALALLPGCEATVDGGPTASGLSAVIQASEIPLSPADGAPGLAIKSAHFDGTTALVGATTSDLSANGYTYVFDFANGAFSQVAKLTAGQQYLSSSFGERVAVDGAHAIVSEGANAFTLVQKAGVWSAEQEIPPGPTGNTIMDAVAISGDTFALGAHGLSPTGSVRVFRESAGTWTLEATLSADDADPTPYFGAPLALKGDLLFVGAPAAFEPVISNGSEPPGAVYVFSRTSSGWQRVQKLAASDSSKGDFFGASVAYDGTTLVVGATGADGGGEDNGALYVFRDTGSGFSEQGRILVFQSGVATNGYRVALDGHLLVTSPYPGSLPGVVEVFEEGSDGWAPALDVHATSDTGLGKELSFGAGTLVALGDAQAHAFAIEADHVCAPDGTSVDLGNGQTQACAPYVCAAGACVNACTDSNSCAKGYVCDRSKGQGACVKSGASSADSGGCATRSGTGSSLGLGLLGLLLALVVGRRRTP